MSKSVSSILRSTLWGRFTFGLLVSLPIIMGSYNGFFQGLENRLDDLRVRSLSARLHASEDIVVIAIDNESLGRMQNAVGAYPWPRDLYAALIAHCDQAKVIAFDILFAETDQQFRGYQYFIESVKNNGKVIASAYLNEGNVSSSDKKDFEKFALKTSAKVEHPVSFTSATVPFRALQQSCKAIGHANFLASPDGVVRTYLLGGEINGEYLPSLALTAALAFTDLSPDRIFENKNEFTLNSKKIPLNDNGSFNYIPHKLNDKYPPYTTYRIADIFSASQESLDDQTPNILPDVFKDKIVLVGALAAGLADHKPTAISPVMPGVYIHASSLDNILNGDAITKSSLPVTALIILLFSVLPAFMKIGERLNLLLGLGLLASLFYIALSFVLLTTFKHLIPLAAPLSAIIMTFIFLSLLYWEAERTRRRHLEMMETAKQTFTDMLVHDLKGRMSTMVMSFDLMELSVKDSPKDMRLLNTMRSSGNRLLSQVNALLDIRKIEEGRMKLNRQPVDIHQVLRDIITEYKTSAMLVNLRIEEDFEKEANPILTIDIDIFQRIMENIIWNAIQYARTNTAIIISLKKDGPNTLICISNEGKIIPPELNKNLFIPFSDGENNKEKNVKTVSTGLGLAFCKLAMEAHGGEIHLESPCPKMQDGVQLRLYFKG